MATKKKAAKETETQSKSNSELAVEAGTQEMVAGLQTLEAARGLARESAGVLASGASNLTRAVDAQIVAERVANLGSVVAAAGTVDLAQGAELLAKSEDVAALSAVVGLMSEDDLERGLELARLAGELQAVGQVVERHGDARADWISGVPQHASAGDRCRYDCALRQQPRIVQGHRCKGHGTRRNGH